MKKYLAYDIGGTHIKYGIVNERGEVLFHNHTDSEPHLGGRALVSKIIAVGKEVLAKYNDIEGVAISTAGQVNYLTGTIVGAGNTIPGYKGMEIKQLVGKWDVAIKEIVAKFYRHLAIGIANLIYIFNPEKVVLGGGITGRGKKFLKEVQQEVQEYTNTSIYRNTEIVLAKHANHSGMLGAVYNFRERQR